MPSGKIEGGTCRWTADVSLGKVAISPGAMFGRVSCIGQRVEEMIGKGKTVGRKGGKIRREEE